MSAAGPHDLVISYGDCVFFAACSCGSQLGQPIRPNESFDKFARRWEEHVMTAHQGCGCWSCAL